MQRKTLSGNVGAKQVSTFYTYHTPDALAFVSEPGYFEDTVQFGDTLYVYSVLAGKGVLGIIQGTEGPPSTYTFFITYGA